jgi:hypothetical protein
MISKTSLNEKVCLSPSSRYRRHSFRQHVTGGESPSAGDGINSDNNIVGVAWDLMEI